MKSRWFVLPLTLILAAFSAFASSFSGVFLFDDIVRIVEEERIRNLWPIAPLLTGERPVVDLSLAVNYALGELRPWGYHAFNLAVHILAGLTLLGIVRRTILRSRKIEDEQNRPSAANRPSTIDNSQASHVAFAVALIFLVHPLQTQSVTYIIQRGESMMGFFYLLTLYCAIRAIESPRRWMWCLASIVACALGMGTKAVMITAPLMVVLYDWVFLAHGVAQRSTFNVQKSRLPLYAGLCATWIVLWLCGIGPEIMGKTESQSNVGFSYQGISAWQYAATQPGVILKYLQLAFWPASLCLDYDWPIATNWQRIVIPSVFIFLLLAITAWLLYRRHWLGFLGAWFFIILAPTSSIVPIKDLMFEHRMYLPLAAIIAAIVVPSGIVLLGSFGNWKLEIGNAIANRQSTIANPTIIFIVVIAVLAAPLAYATHHRNRVYHSELTMWQDVLAKRPNNARAYIAVGNALAARNDLAQALEVTQRASQANPNYADGYCATGNILSNLGRTEEAIASYQMAVHVDPGHSRAWYNLGIALDRLGRFDKAVHAYSMSIELNPRFADAYCNFGNTLMQQNKTGEAIAKYQQAIAINPRHAKAHNNLGDTLLNVGRLEEAQKEFEEAIRIRTDYHKARMNLALLHKQRGAYQNAIEQCRIVLEANPANPAAQDLLMELRTRLEK